MALLSSGSIKKEEADMAKNETHTLEHTTIVKDGKAYKAGDPKAKGGRKLGNAGKEIPLEEAKALGLVKPKRTTKAVEGPDEDK